MKRRAEGIKHALAILFALAPLTLAGEQIAPTAETQLAAPASSKPDYVTRLVDSIEPRQVGTAERLPVYIQHFQREVIGDTRLFAFHVEAAVTDEGTVSLTGHVEFEEQRKALEAFLNHLGFDRVDNRVDVLPAKELGRLRFGLVKTSHSLCREQPTRDAEVVTDSLLGDPVFLLKEARNDFFLCHTAEGYVGYIEGKDIRRVESDSFVKYRSGVSVHVQKDCRAEAGRWIPEGTRLKWSRGRKDRVVVLLPSGEEVSIPAASCAIRDGATGERAERAIENARRLLGTPYLWGGKTSSGIDCSGLVQIAFAAEGINLPRDSSQQVYLGRLTATRWHRDGMRRGDTLYFLGRSGKITHTAIYLGDQRYLESAGRGVRISSFRPEDPNCRPLQSRRLAFAKRLLD